MFKFWNIWRKKFQEKFSTPKIGERLYLHYFARSCAYQKLVPQDTAVMAGNGTF